jgi:hypothetical protein
LLNFYIPTALIAIILTGIGLEIFKQFEATLNKGKKISFYPVLSISENLVIVHKDLALKTGMVDSFYRSTIKF